MKFLFNCYFGNNNVDVVIYDIPKKDSCYLTNEEKANHLYKEQFIANFDCKTHEIVESGSGVALIYGDECFDSFDFKTVRGECGKRIDEMVNLCKSALMEELNKTAVVEEEQEKMRR